MTTHGLLCKSVIILTFNMNVLLQSNKSPPLVRLQVSSVKVYGTSWYYFILQHRDKLK